jgi:hypothetical protein
MQPHRKLGVAEADTCLALGTYMGLTIRPINLERAFRGKFIRFSLQATELSH